MWLPLTLIKEAHTDSGRINLPDGCEGIIFVFKTKKAARAWYGRKIELRKIEKKEGGEMRKAIITLILAIVLCPVMAGAGDYEPDIQTVPGGVIMGAVPVEAVWQTSNATVCISGPVGGGEGDKEIILETCSGDNHFDITLRKRISYADLGRLEEEVDGVEEVISLHGHYEFQVNYPRTFAYWEVRDNVVAWLEKWMEKQ